ncbi:MAG: bifunctional lysylphosphatidylglycerol flippase/synthetase MprF [Steroidobacteraceae bacterium]|nr:bifunctional lysylphosphatidylglycerol flippase/synthetase MprF [Steroidobacteraceae bacterium]
MARLAKARWLGAAIPLVLFAGALFVLHRELSTLHLGSVLARLGSIPERTLVLAAALTAVSYLVLSLYDMLALRYLAKQLSRARTMLTSFVAYAFAHTLSLATLTGAAIRYRLYSNAGLTFTDVALVTAFSTITLATGFALLAGLSFLVAPGQAATALHIQQGWIVALGTLLVAGVAAYVVLAAKRDRVLQIRGWALRAPGPAIAPLQPVLGLVDLTVAGAVLWTLLPAEAHVSFLSFAGVYVVACVLGAISHVPGGVGVFESVILLLLPQVPRDALAGSLIAYRLIYYIVPLCVAGLLFAGRELVAQRARVALVKQAAEVYLAPVVPQLAAALVFLAAVVLLLSGATPGIDTRLAEIRHVLPLPVLELSHLAGSAIGMALLILARALARRVNAAYHIAVWLLMAGIVASLLKGLDFEEAILLAGVLGILYLGRCSFYRSSALMHERFTPGWIASIVAVLIAVTWVGFLAHREVAYSNDLWWTFALKSDASRMLRGSLIASIVAGAFLLSNLLGPPRRVISANGPFDAENVRPALERAETALAQAVLSGDKCVLLSDSGRAFIMYQVARRSWVALGDPVGERSEHESLVWRFRELSDRHGGWTVFYQVNSERLPLYLDLGLSPLKIGEEARVPLAEFSLEGPRRADLRQSHRRAVRDGATFEIVPPEQIEPLLPTLRAISDAWLAEKATAEKGFSVGSFSESYLRHFSVAIVRRGGTPTAFANLWTTPGKEELSIDLMRFSREAARGSMDFLFTELMLWGKAQGYRWFNLGMAPLSGLGTHPLAPAWHRLGSFVYRHGEHFYNFEGLRHYKAKFHPIWEPRYLVAPGGLALPRILADVSILIAGGLKELIAK